MRIKKHIYIIVLFALIITGCAKSYDINVEYDTDMGEVKGTGTYEEGSSATLKAIPNEGYSFSSWVLNDEVVSEKEKLSIEVTENITIKAQFDAIKHTVNVDSNFEDSGKISGSGTYDYGEEVTIKANPSEAFKFVRFSENEKELSTNPTYSFNIKENRDIKAEYKLKEDYSQVIIDVNGKKEVKYFKIGTKIYIPDIIKNTNDIISFYTTYENDESDIIRKARYTDEVEVVDKMKIHTMHSPDVTKKSSKMSPNGEYFLINTENKITIYNSNNYVKKLAINNDENQYISVLGWYDDNSFVYLKGGKLIKHDISGSSKNLMENLIINYGATMRPYGLDYLHLLPVRIEETLRQNSKVDMFYELYHLDSKIGNLSYTSIGGTYGRVLPLGSPNLENIAVSSMAELLVFNLESNTSKSYEFDKYILPVLWRDNNNIIIVKTNPATHDNRIPLDFLNLNISNGELTRIYNIEAGPSYQFSPKNNRLVYTNIPNLSEDNEMEIKIVNINYDKISTLENGINQYENNSIKIINYSYPELYWIDNDNFIMTIANQTPSTYLYNCVNNELIILPFDAKEVLGIYENELLYFTEDDLIIDNLEKYDLSNYLTN